ncbi:MAG: hypothetical protein U0269_25000 [Polyangiales bacterium]
MHVVIDTDLDQLDGRVMLRVWAFRPNSPALADAGGVIDPRTAPTTPPRISLLLYRNDAPDGQALPFSFDIFPADGDGPDSTVTLVAEAQNPQRTVRTRRVFQFSPNRTSNAPAIFLSAACTNSTTGCRAPGPCTVERLCEESGLVCGEGGRCVPPTLVLTEPDRDASALTDASRADAAPRPVECGDRRCSPSENACSCPGDCGPLPGDNCCSSGETRCRGELACADVQGDGCCDTMPCTECLAGQTRCGAECVDTASNPLHCGACSRPCAVGQLCDRSTCTSQCSAPNRECIVGGASQCVDTSTSSSHCGMCGRSCATSERCINGNCLAPPTCAVNFTPNHVQCGSNSNATWTCNGATACSAVCNGTSYPMLDCGAGAPVTVPLPVPMGGLNCVFTARNEAGSTMINASAACSPQPTCDVRLSPTEVACGAQTTATWTCLNSTRCHAECTGLAPIDFDCLSGVMGTAPLTVPAGGLRCDFTVMGAGGTNRYTASASCPPRPACTVRLTPSSLSCPGNVTAEWTCQRATSCNATCNGTSYPNLLCPDGMTVTAPLNVTAPALNCQFNAVNAGGTSSYNVSATCL